MFLDSAGLHDIQIVRTHGQLTDYYNHKKKIIALSNDVYDSYSLSAIGVACHEVGHALQYKSRYAPIICRNIIVSICNLSNKLLWPLVIIGAVLYYTNLGQIFILIGVGIFALATLLNLITLPVEYNASKRACKILLNSTILQSEEVDCVKEVLNAAALTYVAGLVVSILNLLRFILAFARNRD
jgi:Zn-dependent membrane protease YugP